MKQPVRQSLLLWSICFLSIFSLLISNPVFGEEIFLTQDEMLADRLNNSHTHIVHPNIILQPPPLADETVEIDVLVQEGHPLFLDHRAQVT